MTDSTPLSVLVIEDDADTRANLYDILRLDGHQVELAATMAQGLADRDWPTLGVVILDRKLPDGSAEEALPRIRRLAPRAEVIVATGFADLNGAVTALREGAVDYLLKPINPEALRASLRRIAERRRMEESLRKEREFAERLIESAQAIVRVLDIEGRIVRFNPYMERLCGRPLAEVRGLDWFESFTPAAERERGRQQWTGDLAALASSVTTSGVMSRDGKTRHVRWSHAPLKDALGRTTHILSIGQDITDLNEAQQRALRAERLASIGNMITGLAHESRNALQRSQACLEMLMLEVEENPAALDLVKRIQAAQDLLTRLFDEVRGYAGRIQLDLSRSDLAGAWREAWQYLAGQREGRTAVLSEMVQNGTTECEYDRFRMIQVFRNVLENAMAACSDPVAITIRCRDVSLHDRPAIEVSIRDNGPGLTTEQAERIFEPFFTTKTHGTGLGMSIAQRLVEAHGGNVAVGSGSSPGAEIIITLPRKQA